MYLHWNQQTITDFSELNIHAFYNQGYVFTRRGKGVMNQTRSLRIDLSKFGLTSENRRILRKTEDLQLRTENLQLVNYDWKIGKLAKDFYTEKFGDGTFSANKVKELLTTEKSNFNVLLIYKNIQDNLDIRDIQYIGYCIGFQTSKIFHYAFPFYQLTTNPGMGMMLKAILWAQEQGKKYVYLGSATRPTDVYKLQFAGLEWFDGKIWKTNLEELKRILTDQK